MSTASNRSYQPNRHISGSRMPRRPRAVSRAQRAAVVDRDEAFTYALRTAFLHHLLQPRARRKQYVNAPPKPLHTRSHSSMGHLIQDFVSTGNTGGSMKLPHSFRGALFDRMQGVLRGTERMPGYNDAAVKRCFAEAYTAFTEKSFQKTIDKERKIEPLVLIFFSSATKAAQKAAAPGDESWRLLPDRHVALFIRLVIKILRDHGQDRDRPELLTKLTTLENKLLTNDQNLIDSGGQDGKGKTIEVVVPFSYDVKDMPMVQTVARIFGYPESYAQTEIDSHKPVWTEEAALRDLKAYQHRLNSNITGALCSGDFETEEAFEDWKKSEAPHLSRLMLDILTARPELAKTSTTSSLLDKPLPTPSGGYEDDQAYADLARLISSPDETPMLGYDSALGMGPSGPDDSGSIRSVDEANYTFIPYDPRAFYKAVLQQAVANDQSLSDPSAPYTPLSKLSQDLLMELAVYWRIPQSSRLITIVEISVKRFNEGEITLEDLDTVFDIVKTEGQELKKPPHVTNYSAPLTALDPTHWTVHDRSVFQRALQSLHEALLRDLYNLLIQCYDPKPPSIALVMGVLLNHVVNDPNFSRTPEEDDQYAEVLAGGLRRKAADVYRSFLDQELPANREEWDFGHVVRLGQAVIKLSEKIKKRYRKTPEILGASPMKALVETVLPSFQADAKAIIEQIMACAKEQDKEIPIDEGFLLYKELVEIRRIHMDTLPSRSFAFDVEDLLVSFVWRWIDVVGAKVDEHIEEAIRQDKFHVRPDHPDQPPLDSQRHSLSIIDTFTMFNQTAEQIFQLEWNNEIHYARFMTALARVFANGIGRYCEIVWEQFVKEMDRPSAQETAAVSMTAQEKWLQYAKDAWNNKERIEPFQFYSESFVKLNNIEFAMQELDKLEKAMNAERCAALLDQVDGPKRHLRKPTKYVFTVKIIEAEDLKACDPNGYSDPYVVLGDEYQKRLAKTRIIYRNLNPRWDESVDITVQGPLNLIATIWDYDTFGDHDFVGRTSLKLDPLHFSDYLPREFWLDLDTQGRLLVRVSMEGERDDIQFSFGKAFRHLKRTERDMVRKITGKLTSYIDATLSRDTLRSLARTGGIGASMTSLWKKRTSEVPALRREDIEGALEMLLEYFNDNFAIMKLTLTDATMIAVMTRLWKEVLMAIESLLVPPLSDKPSTQKPLNQRELDIVYQWLQILLEFFNARDAHSGEQLGVPLDVLKSPKWHELASLNFFYNEDTNNLIRESERMASATAQRAQAMLRQQATQSSHRLSAPAAFGASFGGAGAFASMGTIRRGKSIMMSRNLGTMRKAKEERRKDAQADPSDDMILRILRMRPEAAGYLKDRHRQKERQAAASAAALIVKNSVGQTSAFGRNNLPLR
ncbi:hypothetical protein jhhlp_007424 [Lomentospora prolificans]|uniref:C2 domain-containing protein n=1 Tax=Lomentospora prolificans TaxID=41688 RepID=A0A2N3N2M6_9PEZI|nr:hypothetical protein jhhlp_007424 [Lomentospora prolificans]